MAGSLYRAVLCILVDVGQDGVGGIAFVWAVYGLAAGNRYLVTVFGAAFGNQQIVPAILLVDMRSFRVCLLYTSPSPRDRG